MTPRDYVKWIFEDPTMDNNWAEAILWGCTGWPTFFIGNPLRCLTKQLYHAKRSLRQGFTIDEIFMGQDSLNPPLPHTVKPD